VNSIISTDTSSDALLQTEPDELFEPSAADYELRTFEVSIELHGQRLDRALVDLVPEFSRSYLQQLADDGAVTLNGTPLRKNAAKLKAGDQLSITLRPTPQSLAFKPEAMNLDIVFQDEHLLIVNKRAGIVVHPAAGNWSGTLLNGLLVARTRLCMDALVAMIAAREVSRQYIAIGHRAWPGEVHRHVDAPIGRDIKNRLRMAVVDLLRSPGKEAMTDFELLSNSKLLPQYSKGLEGKNALKTSLKEPKNDADDSNVDDRTYCLLRCVLHTGRTHQIRVHAAHIAHPLVGDAIYGGAPGGGLTRQALHAQRLAFCHPMTGEDLVFTAPLPEDLLLACEQLGLVLP
jgi:23S rRNA pseudouridine1911/1915/1917 synthase